MRDGVLFFLRISRVLLLVRRRVGEPIRSNQVLTFGCYCQALVRLRVVFATFPGNSLSVPNGSLLRQYLLTSTLACLPDPLSRARSFPQVRAPVGHSRAARARFFSGFLEVNTRNFLTAVSVQFSAG